MNIFGAIAVTIGAALLTVWFLSPAIAIGYFIAYLVIDPTDPFYLAMAGVFTLIAMSLIGVFIHRWKRDNA